MNLPDFPVDDSTLDVLWASLHPGPEAERSSVWDTLQMFSELGGSDTEAVSEIVDGIHIMRDPQYHVNDVLTALITEIRRLRTLVPWRLNRD